MPERSATPWRSRRRTGGPSPCSRSERCSATRRKRRHNSRTGRPTPSIPVWLSCMARVISWSGGTFAYSGAPPRCSRSWRSIPRTPDARLPSAAGAPWSAFRRGIRCTGRTSTSRRRRSRRSTGCCCTHSSGPPRTTTSRPPSASRATACCWSGTTRGIACCSPASRPRCGTPARGRPCSTRWCARTTVALTSSWAAITRGSGTTTAPKPLSAVEKVKEESHGLRGDLAAQLATAGDHFSDAGAQLLKFHGTYQQEDRDQRRALRGTDGEPAHQFMVRCKIPGGVLTGEQYLVIDELADRYGNGTLRVTTRQGNQFHGVLKGDLKATIRSVNDVLVTTLA